MVDHYTLTGAADWPMLATVGGVSLVVIQIMVIGLIGIVWKSLPKHADFSQYKAAVTLDIEKLALRFEHVLEKHMDREQADSNQKNESHIRACDKHRSECQARIEKQLDLLFEQRREG